MKPAVYSQLYIHLVFAVKNRETLLKREIRPDVFKYINGIIENSGCKAILINAMSDHIHILLGLNPAIKISDIVYNIKRSSSLYINKQKLTRTNFQWQDGYGAFSYSNLS